MEHIQYIGIPLCAASEENDEDHILFLSYAHCSVLSLSLCLPCLFVLACSLRVAAATRCSWSNGRRPPIATDRHKYTWRWDEAL